MSDPGSVRSVEFETGDGVTLAGDLALPAGAPVAAAIVCHPHPRYGGDRFDHVVTALFRELPVVGIAALRFDFRRTFDDGIGERLDALAALDALDDELADEASDLTRPVVAVGYSFGAAIAASLDDERIAAAVLVAPPLAVMATERGRDVPTLVLTPAHDQFSPPAATQQVLDRWTGAAPIDHRTVEMADHFLHGATARVAAETVSWLAGTLTPS